MENTQLVVVNNPMKHFDRDIHSLVLRGESLLSIRQKFLPADINFSLALNGRVVPEGEWENTLIYPGDCVVCVPKVEFTVAAGATAGWVVMGSAAATFASAAAVGLGAAYAIVYALTYIVMSVVGGLLINAVMNALFGDSGDSGVKSTNFDKSQTYGWNPKTTQSPGNAIPRVYGEIKQSGNIIQAFTETTRNPTISQDQTTLNVLLSFGYGPIAGITDHKLSEQDIQFFTDVVVSSRLGQLKQGVIPGFETTKTEYPLAVAIRHSDDPYVYRTVGNSFDGIEVDLRFPKGIAYLSNNGGYVNHSINVRVRFKKVGTDDWTYLSERAGKQTATYHIDTVDRWHLVRNAMAPKDSTLGKLFASNSVYVSTNTMYGGYLSVHPDILESMFGFTLEQLRTLSLFSYSFEVEPWSLPVYTISGPSITSDPRVQAITGYYQGGWWWYHPAIGNPTGSRWIPIVQDLWEGFTEEYQIFSDANSSSITVTLKSELNLPHGQYDIEVSKMSGDFYDIRYSDSVELSAVREVVADDFSYPREVLVGTKALATGQLSGSFDYSGIVHGSLLRVYDDATEEWSIVYSNNPAWVCYDIITQPVFYDPDYVKNNGVVYVCKESHTSSGATEPGAGANWTDYWVMSNDMDVDDWADATEYENITDKEVIRYEGYDPSKVNLASFVEWADWCDELVDDGEEGTEKRFVFNGSFDSQTTLWEAASQVAQGARASLIWNGFEVIVTVDKARTPVQLFSQGNVIEGSFEEIFLPYEDRASEIEVSFLNEEKDYERDIAVIYNSDIGNTSNKISMQLIGTTKYSQAWRVAQHLLLCNQYLKRTISFKADIDAISCSLGDVINFQSDIPRWGLAGGRLVSATENTVTLDQEVTVEIGSYSLLVRIASTDDSGSDLVVTKTIVIEAGATTDTFTVSTPFAVIPAEGDVFALGELNIAVKPFTVIGIEQSERQIFTIRALEYNENVYSVDTGTPVVPAINYSVKERLGPVTDLSLKDESFISPSGDLIRCIRVRFKKPTGFLYRKAVIYYESVDDKAIPLPDSWTRAGETESTSFRIENVFPRTTYRVFVASVSHLGEQLPIGLCATSTISTQNDPDTSPPRIAGLQLFDNSSGTEFDGIDCKFVWNEAGVVSEDYGAGEELMPAGGYKPPVWFKDYLVKIYDGSGNLRRTESCLSANYVYTLGKNNDDGDVTATVRIGVIVRDVWGGESSEEITLTASNSAPDDVTGIAATSVVGGVAFSWDKNEEEDLLCYLYRTKVEDDSWSEWVNVEDNKLTRIMTTQELTDHGTNAQIYIEVKVKDVFAQTSATAATANTKANVVSDNIFRLIPSKSGGTGDVEDLYNGVYDSGGVVIT